MKMLTRSTALAECLLVLPGALFMAALFVRNIQPAPYEPAQFARRLVEWFSLRPFLALDVFLIALPFVAFLVGCAVLFHSWRTNAELPRAASDSFAIVRANFSAFVIALATLSAGGILAIVFLHLLTE
jgi:hypothetical protein